MSFEVLIRPGALANSTMVFSKGNGSNYEYDLQASANGALTWSVYTLAGSNVAQVAAPAGTAVVAVPILVGGSYDRAAAVSIIYANGREVARSTSFSSNSGAGSAALQIARRADAGGVQYWGAFGHLQVYDKVLGAGRFAAHAQAARHGSARGRGLMVA
jgi:hypothetical protein